MAIRPTMIELEPGWAWKEQKMTSKRTGFVFGEKENQDIRIEGRAYSWDVEDPENVDLAFELKFQSGQKGYVVFDGKLGKTRYYKQPPHAFEEGHPVKINSFNLEWA